MSHCPSKHLLVFKTSWSRHVLKTSSIRVQRNNFSSSKTSWRHPARRLEDVEDVEDVLKTCFEDVLKTYLEDMSWRRPENMLWKHLQEVLETKKMGISVSHKSKCVCNKSIFHKSISDHETIIWTGITRKKVPLQKSIEFGMALK